MGASPDVLRVETGSVALVRRRNATQRTVVMIALAWVLGIASLVVASSFVVLCVTPIALLGVTAILLGRRIGAPVVGVRARGEPGALLVGDGAVEVDLAGGRVGLLREPVAGGWIETWAGRDEVVLETRSGTLVRATVEGPEQAHEVLRAAGVAAEQRAVTLRLGADVDAAGRSMFVFLALVLAPTTAVLAFVTIVSAMHELSLGSVIFALITAFLGFGLWLVLRPLVGTTVRVGTDAVVVTHFLERYVVPRAEVRDVLAKGAQIVIERTRGPSLQVHAPGVTQAVAVVERIREALADRAGGASLALERLDRRGRSADAWLRDLRALTSEAGGYREATIEPRALLEVVEDGGAPVERRIAAAAALSALREPETKARVRVAAEACVDDGLRGALELAGEGELAEALEAAEEMAPAKRGRA